MNKVVSKINNQIAVNQVRDNHIIVAKKKDYIAIVVNARGFNHGGDIYYCGELFNNMEWSSSAQADNRRDAINRLLNHGYEIFTFDSYKEFGEWLVENV